MLKGGGGDKRRTSTNVESLVFMERHNQSRKQKKKTVESRIRTAFGGPPSRKIFRVQQVTFTRHGTRSGPPRSGESDEWGS